MKTASSACLNKFCATIALLVTSATASAAPWTTVGSAGTVDESDQQSVVLSGAGANIAAAVSLPETATLRYNIVAVDDLLKTFGNLGGVEMSALFRDNSDKAQIRLRLREVDNRTGTLRTVLTLDSNAFPAAPGFQERHVDSCDKAPFTPFNFDFGRKAYYVEAELVKGAVDALPSLGTIAVHPVICIDIE